MFAYGYTTKSKVFLIKHIECRNQTSRYERQKTKKKWTLRVNGNGLNDMVNDMAKITLAHDDDDDDTHTHTLRTWILYQVWSNYTIRINIISIDSLGSHKSKNTLSGCS